MKPLPANSTLLRDVAAAGSGTGKLGVCVPFPYLVQTQRHSLAGQLHGVRRT